MESEAENSSLFSADTDIRNIWSYKSTLYALINHRENFTLTLAFKEDYSLTASY